MVSKRFRRSRECENYYCFDNFVYLPFDNKNFFLFLTNIKKYRNLLPQIKDSQYQNLKANTVWKVSVLRVFIVRILPILNWIFHSVRMRENTHQKNSKYGHFLRSVKQHTFYQTTNSKHTYWCHVAIGPWSLL